MTEQTKNEQMIKESRILQELQERMLKGIQAIENDHVMARGYEQYNEGWDHALARVRALLKGVVNDLMKLAAEDATLTNPDHKSEGRENRRRILRNRTLRKHAPRKRIPDLERMGQRRA